MSQLSISELVREQQGSRSDYSAGTAVALATGREREEQLLNCKQKLHQMEVGKQFINQTHFHLLVSS